MTELNKRALREKIKNKRKCFDTQTIIEVDVLEALLDELEAAENRMAELEAKLANPVSLPKTNGYWNEQEKAYEEAITLARRQIRLAGFRCEGDE